MSSKMATTQYVQTGFAAADTYDTHRPSYPPEAVAKFKKVLEIDNMTSARVVDLAAGTGKFTEILASQPETFDIIAIEPHAAMREQLAKKKLNTVTVVDGSAEDMGTIEDSSVAAVVAATAFHWFSNMDALKEIHRVLRPTGVFGMIWIVEDHDAPLDWKVHDGWESTVRDIMWKLTERVPSFKSGQWKKVFDEQSRGNPISLHFADPLFGLPIGEESMVITERLSKQAIWDRIKTYTYVANLDNEQRADIEKKFWDAVSDPEVEADAQGRIAVHGQVVWAWASKIPDVPLQSGGNPDE